MDNNVLTPNNNPESSNNSSLKYAIFFLIFSVVIVACYFLYLSLGGKSSIIPGAGNPFGNPGDTTPVSTSSEDNNTDNNLKLSTSTSNKQARIYKIWPNPVAGMCITTPNPIYSTSTRLNASGEEETVTNVINNESRIVFFDKQSGLFYQYDDNIGTSTIIINNPTYNVGNVIFNKNCDRALVQYVLGGKINSFIANIPIMIDNTPRSLENIITLPNDIISVTTDGESFFYLVKTTTGSTLYKIKEKIDNEAFITLPLFELTLGYYNGRIYAYTKPSTYDTGTLFFITNNGFYKAHTQTFYSLSYKQGLSRDSGIISANTNEGYIALNYNNKSNSYITYDRPTLAEKCAPFKLEYVCGTDNSINYNYRISDSVGLADDWYAGRISFDDQIYIYDNNGKTTPYILSDEIKEKIDIWDIISNLNYNIYTFINRKDESLWLFKI